MITSDVIMSQKCPTRGGSTNLVGRRCGKSTNHTYKMVEAVRIELTSYSYRKRS